MTYDEWKKARVEAAIEGAQSKVDIPYPHFPDIIKAALKAADAVPLPSDIDLVEILARKWCSMDGKDWEDRQDGYLADASELFSALRPWLASMIKKGK